MNSDLQSLYECILEGDMGGAPGEVQAVLDNGMAPDVVLNEGMIPAMAEESPPIAS